MRFWPKQIQQQNTHCLPWDLHFSWDGQYFVSHNSKAGCPCECVREWSKTPQIMKLWISPCYSFSSLWPQPGLRSANMQDQQLKEKEYMSLPNEQKWQWQVPGIRPESLRQIWKSMQRVRGAARGMDGDKVSLNQENISIWRAKGLVSEAWVGERSCVSITVNFTN